MIYTFAEFELDLAAFELRADGKVVSLQPQVFALIALLVENGERFVSKDELVEKVWEGRVVSDAAVASRVKSARQALGDDGKSRAPEPRRSAPAEARSRASSFRTWFSAWTAWPGPPSPCCRFVS